LALLPRESAAEQEDELRQLNLELEEYKRFQQVARELGRRAGQGSWQRPVAERLAPHELPLPSVSLSQLAEAFGRALRQAEPTKPTRQITAHLSQETIMKSLRRRLQKGGVELQQVLDEARSRLEIIVTFLAVLELVRAEEIRVTQAGQFAPLMMEAAHG
jgi:segregation and condensation protein A